MASRKLTTIWNTYSLACCFLWFSLCVNLWLDSFLMWFTRCCKTLGKKTGHKNWQGPGNLVFLLLQHSDIFVIALLNLWLGSFLALLTQALYKCCKTSGVSADSNSWPWQVVMVLCNGFVVTVCELVVQRVHALVDQVFGSDAKLQVWALAVIADNDRLLDEFAMVFFWLSFIYIYIFIYFVHLCWPGV